MSDALQLEKQLCFRLYSLNKLICRVYGPVLKALELTYPQYLAMLVLWKQIEGISVKALGEQLDLDSGTLSPLLKRMEVQGLLTRIRQAQDERIVVIKLTEKGVNLRSEAEHIPETIFNATGLTVDKLNQLNQELDQLIANINE